jgi:hypothetical protein
MSSQETNVIKQVQISATAKGWRLFRNSVGLAWAGNVCEERTLKDRNGTPILVVELSNARRVHYGLVKGSSDLVGWAPRVIQPEDVGKTLAVFVAIECKTKAYGRTTEEQDRWLSAVANAGGMAYLARESKDGVTMTEIEPDC